VSPAGHQRLKANAATMDDLAFHIATWVLHTPVLNQTGLSGHYKFRLDYSSPDSAIPAAPANQNQPVSPGLASGAVFSAVEQQLGLRLTARKMPVPVLIVDRAEPPTEN
jgi:uncharacterized protein (TIGR03435 family)